VSTGRIIRVAAKTAFTLVDPFLGPFPGPRVLIYHQIGTDLGREMEISTEVFRRQLDWMTAQGEIVDLPTAIERRGEQDAHRLFVLTFDDGFEDVYLNAFPLLADRGLPFTLYLTTEPIETGSPLDPRYPAARPLTWEQVNDMIASDLVTLGAHTHAHLDLRHLSPEAIAEELDTSNRLITERTRQPPRHFTYPWGWWSPAADSLVRERYESATVGGGGPILSTTDPYRIPRLPIQRSDGLTFFRHKIRRGARAEYAVRRRLRRAESYDQSSRSTNPALFLINSLDQGGAERSLVELVPALRAAGYPVLIVCLKATEGSLTDEARSSGAEVIALRSRSWAGWLVEVRRLLRDRRPCLVHTTLFEANMLGRLAAIGAGTPVVMSLVNTPYDSIRLEDSNVRPWKLGLIRLVDGWTARHLVDRFHAITDAVKTAAVRDLRIDPGAVTVIPRSRSRERLGEPGLERRHSVRTGLGLPDDAFVLLNVGRQEYQKGQRYLLEAVAEFRRERPETVALIAGREGNATRDLEALHGRLALGDSVRFLGQREDVGDVLSAADVFVFPSLYEGLGGALLEAMAMGLPIVASDLPAIREVLGGADDATLVAPGDVGSLIRGIQVAAGRGLRHPSRSLRTRFDEHYSEHHVMAQMVGWLREEAIK